MSETSEKKPVVAVPSRRRRWLRRILWSVGAGAVAVGGLVVLAPTLLSTGPGTSFVVGRINGVLGAKGRLAIQDLSLGWTGDDTVRGITFTGSDGRKLMVDDVRLTRLTLLGALLGGRLAEVQVRGVHGEYGVIAAKETPPASGSESAPAGPFRLPKGGALLTLDGLDLAVYLPGQAEAIQVKSTRQLRIDALDLQQVSLDAGLRIVQGDRGGEVSARGRLNGLLAADRSLAPAGADADVQLDIHDLPIAMLEKLAGRKDDLFRTVLGGEKLSLKAAMKGGLKDVAVKGEVRVDDNLLSIMKVKSDGQAIRVESNRSVSGEAGDEFVNSVRLSVTPQRVAHALELLGLSATVAMPEGGDAVLDLAEVVLPLRDDGQGGKTLDLEHASVEVAAWWGGTVQILSAKSDVGDHFTLEGFHCDIGSKALGESIQIAADLPLAIGKARDHTRFALDVQTPLKISRSIAVTGSLPIQLADTLANQSGKLTQAVGDRLTFKSSATGIGAERTPFVLDLGEAGKAVSGHVAGVWAPASGLIIEPSAFHLDLPASAVGAFVSTPGVNGRLTADVVLKHLVFNPANMQVSLLGVKGLGELDLAFDVHVPTTLVDAVAKQDGRLEQWLGADLALSAKVTPAADGQVALAMDSSGPAHVLTLRGVADVKAARFTDSAFSLRVPAALLPAFVPVEKWQGKAKPDLSAAAPLEVQGRLHSLAYVLDAKQGDAGVAGLSNVKVDMRVASLPVALVDALSTGDGLMLDLLGPALAVDLEIASKDGALAAMIAPQSATMGGRIVAEVRGSAQPESVALSGGLTCVVKPAVMGRYLKATQKEGKWSGLDVAGDLPLSFTLDGTRLALKEFAPDLTASVVQADFSGAGAALVNPANHERFALSLSKGQVRGSKLTDQLQVHAELGLQPASGETGVVVVDAALLQPVDAKGQLCAAAAQRTMHAAATGVPTALADAFARNQGDLVTLLGERITRAELSATQLPVAGSKYGEVQGRVQAFTTPKATLTPVDFTINKDGIVRLGGDAVFSVQADATVAKAFGPYVHPLLGEVRGGDKPVRMAVSGKDFYFNLNDPAAPETRLSADFDAGSLQFNAGGLTSKLVDALEAAGVDTGLGRGAKSFLGDIPVVPIRLHGRELAYSGFQVRMGKVTLDTAGALDWKDQKLRLNMAIPPESLLKMSKKFEGMAALQIPIGGALTDPSLDLGAPVLQIGKHFAKRELGDKAGELLGGLLGGKKQPKPESKP